MNPYSKLKSNTIDDYMSIISKKCEVIINSSKGIKVSDEDLKIPTIKNYNILFTNNYSLSQLKVFVKHYKLKISGNKNDLMNRIFCYLQLSLFAIKIQKIIRRSFVQKYINLHGPAYKNRRLCTNDSDFVTLDSFDNLSIHQFFSYKDLDGFIYGFDIASIYHLFNKDNNWSNVAVKNPYTRNIIPNTVIKNIIKLRRLSRVIKTHINLVIEDDTQNLSQPKAVELRALELFQKIDSLGNYSDPQWFLSLNRNQLMKFVRELSDIFNYRAQLANEIKRNICPPNGNPFVDLNINYIQTEEDMTNVKRYILEILEKLVNNGINEDSKSLGSYYVLAALTLVNDTAASALPWLYQSVTYV
jgi:hypothetical protein